MSKEQLLAEILGLPVDERRELIGEALDSLPAETEVYSLPPGVRAELERRHADMLEHPERESSWEEVSARLLARKKQQP